MSTKPELQQVTGWLADLANMTAGAAPLADSKSKIATMASMLVDKFPPAAFCRQSLDAVAQECRFFPPYADVIKHLGTWWWTHQPATPALEPPPTDHYERYNIPPPRTPPTEAELAAVGEIVAAFRMESAARQVSAAISSAKPVRPPRVLTDAELLAVWQKAAPNSPRTQALAEKIRAAKPVPA